MAGNAFRKIVAINGEKVPDCVREVSDWHSGLPPPGVPKIVAVNAWTVPHFVRVSARCCFLPTPPGLRAVSLAGFAVPVPCRAAASVGEASRATRNRKRAAQESPVHSPASGFELPARGHPSGSTFWVGVWRAEWVRSVPSPCRRVGVGFGVCPLTLGRVI